MAKLGELSVFMKDGMLCVRSPYDPAFVHYLKALGGGKWEPKEKVWRFDSYREREVLGVIKGYYGVDMGVGGSVVVATGSPVDKSKALERVLLFAGDLAKLMPLLSAEEKEQVYEIIFVLPEKTEELKEI